MTSTFVVMSYSLGLMLYEALAGRPAFDLRGDSLEGALRKLREDSPTALSIAFPQCPRDLELIVARAIAKSKDDRYGSANDLADDLLRFLENRPVEARPPHLLYRARKFVVRHKGFVAALLLSVTLLTIGLVGTISGYVRAQENERIARWNAETLNQAMEFQIEWISRIESVAMAMGIRDALLTSAKCRLEVPEHGCKRIGIQATGARETPERCGLRHVGQHGTR